MEAELAAGCQARGKSVDDYDIKLVSAAIHLAGRLSCICLHLLKS